MIIFQTVTLQRVNGVYGSRNIHDRIDSELELWNKGSYDELVHDSHRSEEEYLGNEHGDQTQEQRKIFKPYFKREITQSRPFYCEQETGGGGGGITR